MSEENDNLCKLCLSRVQAGGPDEPPAYELYTLPETTKLKQFEIRVCPLCDGINPGE
jgi:hypothetical protein